VALFSRARMSDIVFERSCLLSTSATIVRFWLSSILSVRLFPPPPSEFEI
jgi:hypothetical protein